MDSKLNSVNALKGIANRWIPYVIQQQLNVKSDGKSAVYWLDDIPKSDDAELKEGVLKAFSGSGILSGCRLTFSPCYNSGDDLFLPKE